MDTLWAPDYDVHWGHINPTHRRMIQQFLALCPPTCTILDAACGTGKYWPLILASGHRIFGIDQSSGMLAQARARFPQIPTEKVALQDIPWIATYPGIICIDAMENISPEDWPLVLVNLVRSLTPTGCLYFTVELESPDEIRAAYEAGKVMSLPLVEGEHAHEGGYHYYPTLPHVREWSAAASLTILSETEGDGYYHAIAQKTA